MSRGNVCSGLSWLMLVALYNSSCKGAEPNSTSVKDTSVLAANREPFAIGNEHLYYQAELPSTGKKFSAGKKTYLILDTPLVAKNPDGVYEVYITRQKNDVTTFSSSHPGFVNVLDLYKLTTDAVPPFLSVSLPEKTMEWGKDGQAFPPLVVTILFRGNRLPGNEESKQAGQVNLKGIRIVQE